MPIAKQLTIRCPDRPGALARIAELLAQKKINIQGLDASGVQAQVRLLVNRPARAAQVLRKVKMRVKLEDVVVVTLPDRPGSLARAARKLANRRININFGYATAARGGRRAAIVFGVGNARRAARLLG